jgi:hypothetical protein
MPALLLPLLLAAVPAQGGTQPAGEPPFCVPDVFIKQEIAAEDAGAITRLHAYRLGSVVLAGMAIGESEAAAVADLAADHGAAADELFCTWYVNRGNAAAEKRFHHVYVPNPSSLSPDQAAVQYGELLGPAFAEGKGSIWWCLEEKGYLAVGCNGQKHRGPTVFGMVLAALGCSPENAAEIVNRVWGLNGVPPANRLAPIRQAYDLGAERFGLHPRMRERLLGSPPVNQE